jgi:hypothetical protein
MELPQEDVNMTTYETLWKDATIHIFDAPFAHGNIQQRMKMAMDSLKPNANIRFVQYWKVKNLQQILHEVRDNLGRHSGLILRDPKVEYIQGRSPTYLKFKVEHFFQIVNLNNVYR